MTYFTVSLSGPQPAPVTVDFATADGTATAGSDYTAATGTVTFAPGVTSQQVTVQTLQDTAVEGTENFNVNLSNPSANATILDGTGVGTILDDDVPNQAPTANAGPDQTVDSGATVQLNGSGSTDPEGQALTYMWTALRASRLSDPTSATPTFTAPTGPATLTFSLQVCDPEPLCDTDTVVINVNAPAVIDADGETIVNGPTKAKAGSKTYTLKVTNNGTAPLTFNLSACSGSVTVGGAVTGTVAGQRAPTRSTRVRASGTRWSGRAGTLATGLAVVSSACVNVRVHRGPTLRIAVPLRGSPLAELAGPMARYRRAEGLRPSAGPPSQRTNRRRDGMSAIARKPLLAVTAAAVALSATGCAANRLDPNDSSQQSPAISGQRVVWEDSRDAETQGTDVYMSDTGTAKDRPRRRER